MALRKFKLAKGVGAIRIGKMKASHWQFAHLGLGGFRLQLRFATSSLFWSENNIVLYEVTNYHGFCSGCNVAVVSSKGCVDRLSLFPARHLEALLRDAKLHCIKRPRNEKLHCNNEKLHCNKVARF